MTNCQAILRAGGAGLDDVIEVGILLTNPADFVFWDSACSPARHVNITVVEVPLQRGQ
jgi:2-iminobutanoate/2-iminopropanoate deaminase